MLEFWSLNMWSGLIVISSLISLALSATITGVSTIETKSNESTLKGSFRGGADLYFTGDFVSADPNAYSIHVGAGECKVVHFNSNENKIHCVVPALPTDFPSQPTITFKSSLESVEFSSGQNPIFSYEYDRTPWILYMNPTEACPGDEVAFVGRWGTTDWSKITEARIGTQIMTILDEETGLDYWGWFNVTAIVNDNIHGDTGAKILLNGGFGHSANIWLGIQYDSKGEAYNFRTVARIDSLSNNEGSVDGGLLLSIYGAGFSSDKSLYRIFVGDAQCVVKLVAKEKIVCETTAVGAPSSTDNSLRYPGAAGLKRELWHSSESWDEVFLTDAEEVTYIATPQIKLNEAEYLRSRITAYFVAPVSGEYKFHLNSDDQALVKLSTDEQEANAQTIITFTGWSEIKDKFTKDVSVSSPVTLTAGQAYYLEARHAQGTGGSHFELGVEFPGSGVNKFPFIQKSQIVPTNLVREIQKIKIGGTALPTGGNLVLGYGTVAVSPVAWDSASSSWRCSDIVDALGKLGLGTFQCLLEIDSTSLTYSIIFAHAKTTARKLFAVDKNQLVPPGTMATVTKTAGSLKVDGTFTVTYKGVTTKPIGVAWWIKYMERELNTQLPDLNSQLVLKGQANGDGVYLYFILPATAISDPNSPDLFTLDVTGVIGGGVEGSLYPDDITATLTSVRVPGNTVFYNTIPSEYLRTIESKPQVVVEIDGRNAVCRGDCSFVYKNPPIYPKVSVVTVNSLTLDITGELFDASADATTIRIGYALCVVTSISETSISCDLPLGPTGEVAVAGTWTPKVHIVNKGFVVSESNSEVTIPLVISSVSPASGSEKGGTLITISGTGFLNDLNNLDLTQTVKIGDSPCNVKSTTSTSITCETSIMTTDSTITVTVGIVTQTTSDFEYLASDTPVVSGISVSSGSTIVTTEITFTGTGFGTDQAKVDVKLKGDINLDCLIFEITDTQIKCNVNGGPRGVYTWSLWVNPVGYADFGVSTSYELKLQINSISPASGSLNGGTLITVTGEGFSTITDQMLVLLGTQDNLCIIQSTESTTFTCLTSEIYTKEEDTDYEFILYGRLTDRATCPSGSCNFMWSDSSTPAANAISPNNGKAGDSVVISGENFGTNTADVTVLFGEIQGTVTDVTETSVTVTVPYSAGLTLPISLSVSGKGIATSALTFTNNINIEDVNPKEISQAGAVLEITGSGFADGITFSFGSSACTVVEIEDSKLTCNVAGYSTDENVKLLAVSGVRTFTCVDSTKCGINFLTSKTLTVTGKSGNLVIAGSFPSVDSADVSVKLLTAADSYTCIVSAVTTTSINCSPNAPPGTYTISVYIKNYGFSTGTVTYTITLAGTSASAASSSFNGGQLLTVTGTGLYETTVVRVCGSECTVSTTTGTELKCVIPPLYTKLSTDTFKMNNVEKLNYFTILASKGAYKNDAFDGDKATFFKDGTNTDDYIGADVGSGWKFELRTLKFIGGGTNHLEFKSLYGTVLQASNDGITWADLNKFVYTSNFWNTWSAEPNTKIQYRMFRLFKAAADSNFAINELEFYGIRYKDTNSVDETCTVTVASSVSATEISLTGTVTYSSSNTAVLYTLSPKLGSTSGGTLLTLTGSGFGTSSSDISVLIDDIPCTISTIADDTITCTTGAKNAHTVKSLEIVKSDNSKVSTQGLLFTYGERWSEYSTWGDEVPPREGETVHIPAGMNLILDQATPLLQAILIEGSLIVEDIPGITIDAYYIFVYGGSLTIGTEDEPFLNDLTITMHGDRNSPSLPSYGNKFIAVRNGVLDIHGKPRTPSWSILDSTALAGATFILLQDEVDWVENDQIVLATTSYDLEESETVLVDYVDAGDNKKVYLKTPLKYKHYAATETYGSETIEIRGEVGLLTRNIKIRGSDQGLDQQHGVHIMLFSPGDESVIGRIENLELFNAGQAFTLGRYPIHFHMVGHVSQSYIKNNAIHHTFNRACTIHGVHYLTIKDNVAYHTMGHTYFTEDGIETYNTLEHNLGINTYQSFSLLNVDQTPAVFWIVNPKNFVINNHAAGGMAYGFWYSMDPHPTGPSSTDTIFPEFTQLGLFQDNTAHSLMKYGLRIFHRFFPSLLETDKIADDTKRDWWDVPNTPVTANFERLTAWKCQRDGAIAEEIGDVRFIDFKVADNKVAGIELTYTHYTKWYETTKVVDALIIGNSGNTENACAGTIGLHTPQTDGLFVDGAKFYNFDDTMSPLGDLSHSFKTPTRDLGARLTKLQRLEFGNSHKKINWGYPPTGFFEILDSSLTGSPGFVAAYWPHLLTPECTEEVDEFNSVVCSSSVKIRRAGIYNLDPFDIFSFLEVNVLRDSGTGIPTETLTLDDGTTEVVPLWSKIGMQKGGQNKGGKRGWHVPLVTGYEYKLHWGKSPIDWLGFQIEQDLFDGEEFVHLKFNFTDRRENFVVNRGVLPAGVKTSDLGFVDTRLTEFKSTPLVGTEASGTFTWNNASDVELFEVIVNGVDKSEYQWGDISVLAYRCFGTHCSQVKETDDTNVPKTEKYWSDASIWPGGTKPVAGSYVEVPSSWHLYLDVDTPVLQEIDINGILEFSPTISATLNANWVFIRKGELRSGTDEKPTAKDIIHRVVLHGEPLDDSFAFNPDIQGGNKVIVVAGKLSLHGYPKKSFTQLEQNIYPGNDVIFVSGVDWDVDDEIVISPSGFEQSEYEVFTIKEILSKTATFDELANGTTVTETDFATDADWIAANNFRDYGKEMSKTDDTQQVSPAVSKGITKIKLSAPVEFYHSGASMTISGYSVDMRTEVALISRNVKITTEGNGWGYTVIVNDFNDEAVNVESVMRNGNTDISFVQFMDCGQLDTNLACLRFESSGTNSSNVKDCSFTDPQTWAVFMKGAKNINFESNLIVNARWRGVVAQDITGVTIKSNVIVYIYQRGYTDANLDAAAGFHICSSASPVCEFEVSDNKVLGYDFAGFIMSAGECDNADKKISGNKARSGLMGFVFTNNGNFECTEITGSAAHFSEEGLGFKSISATFRLKNFEFIENLFAISTRSGGLTNDVNVRVDLSDSVIIGKTIHSLCQDCDRDTDCKQRLGYVFGLSDKGFTDVTLTVKLKIPLYFLRADANTLGMQYVKNVKFMNFNSNPKCSKIQDFAISSNPHSPDYQLPQTFSEITFENVNSNNLIYMHDPDPKWLNEEDCVDWNCTGPLNAIGYDLDGSIVGGSGGVILPNNPGIAKKDVCKIYPRMNAYLCTTDSSEVNRYMVMIFESLDSDNTKRTIAPINITTYGTTFESHLGKYFRNDIAQFQDHVWDGFYTGHIRLSRFPSVVYSGQYYNVTAKGTLPNTMQFGLQATDETQSIIVAIQYKDPAVVNVYLDNTLVEPYKWTSAGGISECGFSDSHGTNRWFHEENTLQFVLRSTKRLVIKKSSSIQINLELNIPVDEFFNAGGVSSFLDRFAAMLNIPSYRIRIVNVRSGSTILDFYVIADDSKTSAETAAELSELNSYITASVDDGTLASVIGHEVLDYSSSVNTISDTVDAEESTTDSSTESSSGGEESSQGEGNNESNDDSTSTNDPNGGNKGSGTSSSNNFKVVAEDWLVAIFGGIIFVLILMSGLVLYTKNVNKSVSLQEINRQFTSKVGVENPLANNAVWAPDRSLHEESKTPI